MPLPPLNPPPHTGKPIFDRWALELWRKVGEAAAMPSESIAANVVKNQTNDGMADSIDAGSSATVRVYGPGGVGSNWSRYRNAALVKTHAAVTFTGKAYATRFYIGYDTRLNTWTISTAFKDVTADNMIVFSVKTVDAGGGGGVSGGGGAAVGQTGGTDSTDRAGYGLLL